MLEVKRLDCVGKCSAAMNLAAFHDNLQNQVLLNDLG